MEEILETCGPWHAPIYTIALLGHLPYGMFAMSMSFMAPKLDFFCTSWPEAAEGLESHGTNTTDQCVRTVGDQSVKCTEWEYDHGQHRSTLTEEWNAVCDNTWKTAVAQGTLMFGTLVGCLVFAHISDWYGRRPSLILAGIVVLISGVAGSFIPTFWVFCVLRFIMAIGHGGKRMNNTLAVESVGTAHRAIVTVGQDLGWCLGVSLAGLVTYHIRDWTWIQRSVVLPDLFFLHLAWRVDESPKWLLSTGRYDEARTLLKRIIKINKLDENINVDKIIESTKTALLLEKRVRKGTLGDLMRETFFFRLMMSHLIQFFIVILVYYQMIYFIVDVGSDPYMSVVSMGLLEVPITIVGWYIVKTFRRKPVYLLFYPLCLFMAAALILTDEESSTLRVILANAGKMTMQIVYGCIAVHVTECFPTPVRSVAIGATQMASRLGAIIAPFLKQLGLATVLWFPMALTVVLTAVAYMASFILPETFGKELPNTFHEAKLLLEKPSPETRESTSSTTPS